jgi:hypothetical protein
MTLATRDKENDDVVPEGEADSQGQTRRLSLQRLRVCGQAKEEALQSEKDQNVGQAVPDDIATLDFQCHHETPAGDHFDDGIRGRHRAR